MLVIPRDLFNHGNLLTNYGHLYIALENIGLEDLLINKTDELNGFRVGTMELSGCTYLEDVKLYAHNGDEIILFRMLNSRETYSLWFIGEDDDYEVFGYRSGELTKEFLETIGYDND